VVDISERPSEAMLLALTSRLGAHVPFMVRLVKVDSEDEGPRLVGSLPRVLGAGPHLIGGTRGQELLLGQDDVPSTSLACLDELMCPTAAISSAILRVSSRLTILRGVPTAISTSDALWLAPLAVGFSVEGLRDPLPILDEGMLQEIRAGLDTLVPGAAPEVVHGLRLPWVSHILRAPSRAMLDVSIDMFLCWSPLVKDLLRLLHEKGLLPTLPGVLDRLCVPPMAAPLRGIRWQEDEYLVPGRPLFQLTSMSGSRPLDELEQGALDDLVSSRRGDPNQQAEWLRSASTPASPSGTQTRLNAVAASLNEVASVGWRGPLPSY